MTYILIEKNEFVVIEQKLPDKFNPEYAVLCNGKSDSVLVDGYCRGISKEIDIAIPNELIDLVVRYCVVINVHFGIRFKKEHYMMPLEDILRSCDWYRIKRLITC